MAALVLTPINTKGIELIGITGTDGKTTTVEMLAHILNELNIPYLSTSSLEVKLDGKILTTSKRTTPSLWQLHKLLKQAMSNGAKVAVIEVSSHSLVQWRVLGLKFDATILTNITHEHLNFHKTKERYAGAKKLLFTRHLKSSGAAILPTNDACGVSWIKEFGDRAIPYTPPVAITSSTGTSFIYNNKQYSMPILGSYNASNAIAAALALDSLKIIRQDLNVSTDDALCSLSNFNGIPGRMQVITVPDSKITAIVDFALTKKAMQGSLSTAREIAKDNRVFVVFGATGGQHDTSVRPGLAEAAALGADVAIVTDDEPYDGNPAEIRDALISYIKNTESKCSHLNIADRRNAIATALSQATNGDVVVVTGIGHYTSRTINGIEEPWNDAKVIKEELLKL